MMAIKFRIQFAPFRGRLLRMKTCWRMALCLPLVGLCLACNQPVKEMSEEEQKARKELAQLEEEGKSAREQNQFEEAIRLHTKELELAKSIGDSNEVVVALNQIGTNYRRLGMLGEAARYHFEALARTKRLPDQADSSVRMNRVRSLNGLGNIYMTIGDMKNADAFFRKALAGEKLLGSKLGQAINLANIGKVKEDIGETDSAWIYYRYSLAMNRQVKSKLGEALCYSHFARLHEKEGNIQEAMAEYQHTIDMLAESPDDWHKLDATLNLARLYFKQGDGVMAKDLLKQSETVAEHIHSLEHRSLVHKLYYEIYDSEGNATVALSHYKRSMELKDSLLSNRKTEQIENMRVALVRQCQQCKLERVQNLYQGERYAHRVTTIVLIFLVLVGVCVIVSLWYTLRERNKTHLIMQQMNKSKEDFFANLAIDPAELKTAETIINEQDRQFLGRFVDVVYSQMGKGKTDVESVAEQMKLSRAQLNRRILSITGQNTLSYITQIRISKAKRLLRADLVTPIGDIATKCGFDDVAYFSRFFKLQTGMTPSQYRRMI